MATLMCLLPSCGRIAEIDTASEEFRSQRDLKWALALLSEPLRSDDSRLRDFRIPKGFTSTQAAADYLFLRSAEWEFGASRSYYWESLFLLPGDCPTACGFLALSADSPSHVSEATLLKADVLASGCAVAYERRNAPRKAAVP